MEEGSSKFEAHADITVSTYSVIQEVSGGARDG